MLYSRGFQSLKTVSPPQHIWLFLYSGCLATWMHQSMFGYKIKETDLVYVSMLWTCLSLCPCPVDRASLQAASCVEKMQELILDLLSRVCGAQGGAARGGPQRFGRLLGRLTELRTLRHNYLLLTRQQPGHWQRKRTGNGENYHHRLWGVLCLNLRTRWFRMSWEIVQKYLGNAKFSPDMVRQCWIIWSLFLKNWHTNLPRFPQLTSVHSVLQSLLNFSLWWDWNVFVDFCSLFGQKIFYRSFYHCCIQLTCTLIVLFTMRVMLK